MAIHNGALDNDPKLVTLMIGTNHLHNPKDSTPVPLKMHDRNKEVLKEIRTAPQCENHRFSVFPRREPENRRVQDLNKFIPDLADNP